MLGENIVAAVVGRYRHNSTRSVTCQYIFGNPDGNLFIGEGVDGIRAREDTCHFMVHLALTLRTLFHIVEIFIHSSFLVGCGQLCYQFTLGSQHHEGNAKHRIGTGGEDGKMQIAVGYLEFYFGSFRTANPVALCLFQGICPFDSVQSIEQTLGISRNTQAPLAHLLLYNGETTTHTHTVNHFVVCQNGAQSSTPVHHRLTQIGDAVVHQYFLLALFIPVVPLLSRKLEFFTLGNIQAFRTFLFKVLNQRFDGLCTTAFVAIE